MSYLLGLDASYAQGSGINYAKAKAAGYEFWIQRVSYAYPGTGCKYDTTGGTNYYGAKAAGFIVGGYHKVGWTDPIAEADFFCKAMQPYAEGDLFAYDKEPSSDVTIPSNWAEWEDQFVNRIHENTGAWPFDYSNISMFNAMPRQGAVVNCGPWLAAPSYDFDATLPVKAAVVMQQGPTVQVPGIPGNVVDTDAFFGTRDELLAYGYHAPVTTPAPVVTPTPAPAQVPVPSPVPVSEPVITPVVPQPEPAPAPVEPTPVTEPESRPQPVSETNTAQASPTPPKISRASGLWQSLVALLGELWLALIKK